MNWLYMFTPTIRHENLNCPLVDLKGGGLEVALKISVIATSSYIGLLTIQYIIPLLFIYQLSTLFSNGEIAALSVKDAVALLVFALSAFFVSVAQVNLERYFSARFCALFKSLLISRHQAESSATLAQMERVASRDLNAVLDGLGSALSVFAIPVFLVCAGLGSVYLYGVAGLWVLILIAAFIPISYGLSVLSDRNYHKVMDKVAHRIEKCSLWIREGPFLKQFSCQKQLRDIQQTVSVELLLRDRDTLLRGIDSYIIGFGRLIPFVLFGFVALSNNALPWEGASVWLAIPLLSAMLALPRGYLSYRTVSRSLTELSALLKHSEENSRVVLNASNNEGALLFDPAWPIWPSRFIDLIPGSSRDSFDPLEQLLSAFGLVPELGASGLAVVRKSIEHQGKNLSDGQRFRLQLIRGVFLAQCTHRRLLINDDFSALDTAAACNARRVLEALPCVQFSPLAIAALERRTRSACDDLDSQRCETPTPVPSGSPPIPFGLGQLMTFCWAGGITLLLPASMMSYAGNLTLAQLNLRSESVLAYALIGIAVGSCTGLFIEASLRRRFAKALLTGLVDVQANESGNNLQIVSRDVTTVFERIAWYAHDMAWVCALFIVSVIALWTTAGPLGLMVALIFSGLLFSMYRVFIDELSRTRLATVTGFDALIRATQVSHSMSCARTSSLGQNKPWLDSTCQRLCAEGLAHFYQTRMASVVARTMTATSCTLLSDLMIALMVLLGGIVQLSGAGFIWAMTGLLLVRSDLSNFFLAVTGFKSQSISVGRLLQGCAKKCKVQSRLCNGLIHVDGFKVRRVYKPLVFPAGRALSLSGLSGLGKSDYLKGISGVIDITQLSEDAIEEGDCLQTYYLDTQTLTLLMGAMDTPDALFLCLSALPADGKQLVFLDETIREVSFEKISEIIERLTSYTQVTGNTVIVVDHRFELPYTINLPEWIV